MRDYFENVEGDKKIDGIRLMVMSDFKITGNTDWILNAVKNCSNDKEAEAWSFLIKYARVTTSAKSLKEWLAVMTAILKNRHVYHPTIRRVALESYERVVKYRESRLKIDEKYLNLPLNKESPELMSG